MEISTMSGEAALVCTLRVPSSKRGVEVIRSWCRYHSAVGFSYAFLFFDDPLPQPEGAGDMGAPEDYSSIRSNSVPASPSSWPPPLPPLGPGMLDHVPAAVAMEEEFGAQAAAEPSAGEAGGPRLRTVVVAGRNPQLRIWQRRHCPSWAEYESFLADEVQARQTMNAETAMAMAAHRGMDWLVHIDSDELFYTGPAVATISQLRNGGEREEGAGCERPRHSSALPTVDSQQDKLPLVTDHFADLDREGVFQMTYLNHEGVPERPDIEDYFAEVTLFRQHHFAVPLRGPGTGTGDMTRDAMRFWEQRTHHGQYLLVYDNGKSATRVLPEVRAKSVHSWILPPPLEEQHQRRFGRQRPGPADAAGRTAGYGSMKAGGDNVARAVIRRRTALADPRGLDVGALRRCEVPCILHFVTCGLRWFMDKYEILGRFQDSWFGGALPIAPSFHLDARDVVLTSTPAAVPTVSGACGGAVEAFFSAQVLFDTEGDGEAGAEARAELERQVRSKVCRRITTIAAILGGKGDWKGVEGASGQALDASDAPPNGGGALHERKVGTRRVARTPPGAFEKAWLLSSIAQEYL